MALRNDLFQSIFHHIFLCGVAKIAHHIKTVGLYSLDFESVGTYCSISTRFRKEDTICIVKRFRYRLSSEPIAGSLVAIS